MGSSARSAPAGGRGALRGVRDVLRRRRDRPGASDISYRVYMTIMLGVIVAAPVVRAAILWAEAELPSPGELPGRWSLAGLSALLALLLLAGAQLGPAHPSLPQVDLLLTTPLSRARVLAGQLARAFSGATATALLGAGVVATGFGLRGELEAGTLLALLSAGAGCGLLGAAALLAGQVGRGVRAWGAAALGAVAVLALLGALEGALGALDAGFARALGGGSAPSPLPTAILLLAGFAATICAPALVRLLRWELLREQAARWDVVRDLAGTGDSRAALARLGAPVTTGRRWRLRLGAGESITRAIVRRDLLGVARTPARSLGGLAGMTAAGLAFGLVLGWAASGGAAIAAAALVGAAASFTAYVSVGPWCRGFRAAAQGVGASPLTPLAPGALLLRHLIVPAALACAVLAAAAAVGALLTPADALAGFGAGTGQVGSVSSGVGGAERGTAGSILPVLSAILGGAVLAAATIALRLLEALKGPIPQALLAPVPTPAGDLSGLNVLVWSLDAPILSALSGSMLATLATAALAGGAAPLGALVAGAILLAVLVAWVRARLVAAGTGF